MIDFNDENLDFATIGMNEIVDDANKRAKDFARKIKTNQIRNFFSAITKMRIDFSKAVKGEKYNAVEMDLMLLKPKLAYAAGRKSEVRPFHDYVKGAIDAVERSNDREKATENFFALIESIVAYHKFYGGRDN